MIANSYAVRNVTLNFVHVAFDPRAVRAILPRNLDAVDACTGGYAFYAANEGSCVVPFSAAYVWVDVKRYDTPDGTAARYALAGVTHIPPATHPSVAANSLFVAKTMMKGEVRIAAGPEQTILVASAEGRGRMTIVMKRPGPQHETRTGTNYFIAATDGVADRVSVIPYIFDWSECEPVSIDISEAPGVPPLMLKPVAILGAGVGERAAFTLGLGTVRPLDELRP